MKKGGRKHGTAYEQYGFISQVNEGKYVAICRYCNRKLQNTSGARLRVHRKSCSVHAVPMKNYDPEIERPSNSNTNADIPAPLLGSEIKIENVGTQSINTWNENKEQSMPPLDENLYEEQIENIQDYLDDNPLRSDININPESISSTKKLVKLQEQKLEAEIHYLQKKSEYLSKEMENQAMKRSLMLLEGKKLRLEIEKMQSD